MILHNYLQSKVFNTHDSESLFARFRRPFAKIVSVFCFLINRNGNAFVQRIFSFFKSNCNKGDGLIVFVVIILRNNSLCCAYKED